MSLKALSQIDNIILPCNDLVAARRFYRDIMGFDLINGTIDWVEVRIGGRRLVLRERGDWLTWNNRPVPRGSVAVQLAFCVAPDEVAPAHREGRGHRRSAARPGVRPSDLFPARPGGQRLGNLR